MYMFEKQISTLSLALDLASYEVVSGAVLAAVDEDPNTPENTKHALRSMAFKMATFNGGNPEAGSILNFIATAKWGAIGIADDALAPLDSQGRTAIVDVLMAVSKQIIAGKAAELANLATVDTSLPDGWNSE